MEDGDEQEYVDMYTCATCGVQFSRRDQYDSHSCEPEIGESIYLIVSTMKFKEC